MAREDTRSETTRRVLRQAELEPRSTAPAMPINVDALSMRGWSDAQHASVRQWAIGRGPMPAVLRL